MHLDVYRQDLQPVLQPGETRPDLVGQTTAGQWVAIESKGRTNGRDARALERAKEQVEALVSVSGVAPALRIALQAHFESGALNCTLDDPEERNQSEDSISRSPDRNSLRVTTGRSENGSGKHPLPDDKRLEVEDTALPISATSI